VITGFNTDIEHEGVVYHVQTEDKGLTTPLILSLVYTGGEILASKRSPYGDLIAAGYDEDVLTERLKLQHRLICAAITAGRIDELKRMGVRARPEEVAVVTNAEGVSDQLIIESAQEATDRLIIESVQEASDQLIIESAQEATDRLIIESAQEASERLIIEAAQEASDRLIIESASERLPEPELPPERPMLPAQPIVTDPLSDDDTLPEFQERSRPVESAYTVYDPRRKSPMGAPVESDSGLVLTILNEREFYSAQTFAIRILLENRSGKKEKPVSGVTLSLRILGTTFRPQIYSVKTGRDGVGVVSGRIPYFDSGRAAIVIRAVAEGNSAELRRVIHPAA